MFKSICATVIIVGFIACVGTRADAATRCLRLDTLLSQGSSDRGTNGDVYALQSYLASAGYLTASPNGYFGPSTAAALKKFQAAHAISQTAATGPLTRSALAKDTCDTVANVATVTTPASIPAPTVAVAPTLVVPAASSTVTVGETIVLRWNPQAGTMYNIILEDQAGIGQGFIATSLRDGSYIWNIGKVFSARTQSEQIVPPGIYRVRIKAAAYNSSVVDAVSGLFTVAQVPLVLSTVMPQSVRNDGKGSVALIGSGMSDITYAYLDGIHGLAIKPAFISGDGRLAVVTIPTYTAAGVHTIQINNIYPDMSASSTESNPLNITITP